jgi:hypothetical protein
LKVDRRTPAFEPLGQDEAGEEGERLLTEYFWPEEVDQGEEIEADEEEAQVGGDEGATRQKREYKCSARARLQIRTGPVMRPLQQILQADEGSGGDARPDVIMDGQLSYRDAVPPQERRAGVLCSRSAFGGADWRCRPFLCERADEPVE